MFAELLPGQALLCSAPGMEQRGCERAYSQTFGPTAMALGAAPVPSQYEDPNHIRITRAGKAPATSVSGYWHTVTIALSYSSLG